MMIPWMGVCVNRFFEISLHALGHALSGVRVQRVQKVQRVQRVVVAAGAASFIKRGAAGPLDTPSV